MKTAGIMVMALVVLAAAQAAAAALYMLALLALFYGVIAYPRETFGLLGFGLVAYLVERQTLACLAFATLAIVAKVLLTVLGRR